MARKAIWFLTLAAALCGCGGGGGGESPAPLPATVQQPPPTPTRPERPAAPVIRYTGRSEQALINDGNAKSLTVAPVRIPVTVRNLVGLLVVRITPNNFAGVLEATAPGRSGGLATLRGVLELAPGSTSIGWLWIEFDNFADGEYKLNGRVVQDVRAPITTVSHSLRMEFTDLELTEPHATTLLNGVVDDVRVNDSTGNRRTVTANLLQRNVGTGEEIWAENFVALFERTFVYASDQTYSGRLHHSAHGYVDVSSDGPLTFMNSEGLPDRGGPMRVQGANASAGLFALNQEYGAVVLDEDNDGVDDRFARLSWAELWSEPPPRNTSSPAIANAGAKRAAIIGETFELDGLLSHDGDASFLTVDWTLAVKPAGSMAALDFTKRLTPSFTPDLPGYYMFTLRVNDPDGVAYDSVVVQAALGLTGLGVQMRLDRPFAVPLGTAVSADASGSRREDLSNSAPLDVLYSWTLGVPPGSNAALTSPTSPTTSFIPDIPGFYRIRVENGVPSTSHRSEMSKVVGFGTGFQYFESAHMVVDAGSGDPVVADFDGDGHVDLATIGTSPSFPSWVIHVWLGDGRGGIRPAADFPIDHGVKQLLHGDLDGDGLPELVTLGQDTLYVVYSRRPFASSTFRTIPLDRGELCGFADSQWAAIADQEDDGRAELLVADRCKLAMLTWRHVAGGALSLDREQAIPALRVLPAFGDLSNDGRADFVVPRDPPSPQAALLVFTQDSNGDFSLRQTLEGVLASAIGIGDLTGDGRDDLVVIYAPVLSVFAQQSNGALASATNYNVGRIAPMPPRFADLNGDGRTDLVAVRERDDLLLALEQPQGPLAIVTLLDDLEHDYYSAAIPVDWNGDGRVDLLRRRHVMNDHGLSVRLRMP